MTSLAFATTPKQDELVEAALCGRYLYIGFGGSIRGTKTWGLLALFILLMRIFPRSRWCIVRKDLERIRKNTLPSFEKLRERTGGWLGPVNRATWEATAANGSQLIFFGENIDRDPQLDRWKGLEVNGFGLEEADELQEEAFVKSQERAGAWFVPEIEVQPPPIIIGTFNPNASWPARIWYEPWLAGTLEEPYHFIPATLADNPYAPESYRTALKNLPPEHYKRFVSSDWSTLTGRFYGDFSKRIHVVPRSVLPEQLPPWWEYWSSFDWGYAHWAVFCWFCRDGDGHTYCMDSIWMRGEQDDEMARTIVATVPKAALGECYAGHDCWAHVESRGGSGVSTAEVFDAHGIYLAKADIDLVNSSRAVRSALKPRPVYDALGEPVIGENGEPVLRAGVYLVDTPGNQRIAQQLLATMPDEKNVHKPAKVNANASGDGGDDGADAFRYGLATRMQVPEEPWPTAEVRAIRSKLDSASRAEAEEWDEREGRLKGEGSRIITVRGSLR